MKKLLFLIIPLLIVLLLIGLTLSPFGQKLLPDLFGINNPVKFDGQVISWKPDSESLQITTLINGKNVLLSLSVDPSKTVVFIPESKEILQRTGKNVVRQIMNKDDMGYEKAFCTGDKVTLITNKSNFASLKKTGAGTVDIIYNIGDRGCL